MELRKEYWPCKDKSFEQIQWDNKSDSLGSELSTVPEYKSINALEVGYGIITKLCSLITFFTHYANSDLS